MPVPPDVRLHPPPSLRGVAARPTAVAHRSGGGDLTVPLPKGVGSRTVGGRFTDGCPAVGTATVGQPSANPSEHAVPQRSGGSSAFPHTSLIQGTYGRPKWHRLDTEATP